MQDRCCGKSIVGCLGALAVLAAGELAAQHKLVVPTSTGDNVVASASSVPPWRSFASGWTPRASVAAGSAPTAVQIWGQCFYSISPTTVNNVSADGASGTVTVGWTYEPHPEFPDMEDPSVCGDNWSASSAVRWISVRETDSDTATYSVDANTTTSARTGTLTVAGDRVTINQLEQPSSCTASATGGGQTGQAITLRSTLTPSTSGAIFRWKATRMAGGQPVETHTPSEGTSSSFTPRTAGRWVFGLTVQKPRGTNLATCTAERTVVIPPNRRPTADAGSNQTVDEGDAVRLDGTASDPDGDTLTYAWRQTSGTSVTLSGSTTASPTFTAPQVTAETRLTFSLTVSDGSLSATDSITVTVRNTTSPNRRSVANAGADQTVNEGNTVTLNGTASDPDGDTLTYAWRQTSGTSVTLRGSTTASPTFTAPQVTTETRLTFRLTVSDGSFSATDSITVTVRNTTSSNRRPVANAGADQTVNEGNAVTLNGTASDPDGDTLTYAWRQTSGPSVTLSRASTARPTFTAPQVTANTRLTFTLTVSDRSLSATDTVTVTVQAVGRGRLMADAGADQTAAVGAKVTLDGTGSRHPNNGSLQYSWTQVSGPYVTLFDPTLLYESTTAPRASFLAPAPPVDTDLVFRLKVTDAHGASATDEATVTVLGNVLTAKRDSLVNDWASRNSRSGNACAEWKKLPASAQEVFIWNTHRLHITHMLPHVGQLYAIYGKENEQDATSCGGAEYNRTYMGGDLALQTKLVNTWKAEGDRFPDWKRTGDAGCYVSAPGFNPECPHAPYQYQVDTYAGVPLGQINFFGPSVRVGRRFLGLHGENCGEEFIWAERSTVCKDDSCICTPEVDCPVSVDPPYCAGRYQDEVVFDPTEHRYTQGPEMNTVDITNEYSFEMDQDYNWRGLLGVHDSSPSCNNMKATYTFNYGNPGWDWQPTACNSRTGFTDNRLTTGVTPMRALHLTELRERVDALRLRFGLATVNWTDEIIVQGVTPARAVHITELRVALDQAYGAAKRGTPVYTDPVILPGATPVRTVHWAELQQAVLALEPQ